MKKYIIVLLIPIFLFSGSIYAQGTDSLSVKIIVSTQLFAKKSVLTIKNNYSTSVALHFLYNHFMEDRTGLPDENGTFLAVKTKDKFSNEIHEDYFPIESSAFRSRILKPDSIIEIPIFLTYDDVSTKKYEIVDIYAKLMYSILEFQQVDNDKGFRILEVRPVEIEMMGDSAQTPCCTPQPGGTLTVEEAKKKKIVNEEFLSLDGCYDNRLAYGDSANHVDTTKISTLFYLAKNSFNTWSLMLRDQYEIYPNSASLVGRYSKYPLKIGVANFKNYYKGLYPSATQSFQTVPLSPYGHYKFTAPSGYDFYSSMKNYYSNYSRLLTEAYFVAYDGSVYCIFISNKNLCNANLHYLNNSFFYSKTLEQLSIRWGFLDGGRMQDEFLDAFIRLYDEGSHFSKEDAYNAAFAYIMEGRGAELYRRAPNETEFKCYNTTPLYEAGSNKINGFNAIIK